MNHKNRTQRVIYNENYVPIYAIVTAKAQKLALEERAKISCFERPLARIFQNGALSKSSVESESVYYGVGKVCAVL